MNDNNKEFTLQKNQFNSALSALDDAIDGNIDDKKKALLTIIRKLEEIYPYLKSGLRAETLIQKPEARLYYRILNAYSNLNGMTYKQQIEDHDKWLQEKSFKGIVTKGVSGTYIDNPGNLLSETLNSVTKLVTQAYQNIRNAMSPKVAEIRKATEELKREAGYTGLA